MQFFPTLVVAAFACSALAAPRPEGSGLDARIARRAAAHQGNPLIRVPGEVEFAEPNSTVSHVEYSSNWAGAVYEAPPSGATFTAVSATFTVPTPTPTGSGSGSFSASAWVGIDGDTCGSAILQTGVDFTATKSGSKVTYSYDAWYEWFPDYAYDFSGFALKAGDVIVAKVVSTSSKAGTASLQNLSTGKSVSKTLSSSAALCGTNAEWIVEDFESGNSMVPLANWGTVTFTGATALTNKGSETAGGASTIDIRQGSTVLTDVSISGSTVQVKHT